MALISLLWLHFRQPETIAEKDRLQFSLSTITDGIIESLKHPVARTYMTAAGISFGALVGYLNSAQQILQIQYNLGNSFSIYFGALALVIGLAAFTNSKLVMRFSMESLCLVSLLVLIRLSQTAPCPF